MGKSRDDNFDQNGGLCRDYTGAGARICWFGELDLEIGYFRAISGSFFKFLESKCKGNYAEFCDDDKKSLACRKLPISGSFYPN